MMMKKENINEQTCGMQSRDYKCPCGKAYLSYPALFTHIKHKHNGKAPGNVEKPSNSNKPRGRPALVAKNSNIFGKGSDSLKDNKIKSIKEKNRNKIYWQQFSQIFVFLSYIEHPQYINEHVWETLDAFKNFENFIDERQFQNSLFFKICLGNSLSEFFKSVSLSTQNWRFEQILLLFISLLEYIKEQNHLKNVITQSPIDIMVEYINPFMSNYLQKFGESYGLKHLWIMQRQNSNKIFQCFYSWLKWKDYTNFCITLID